MGFGGRRYILPAATESLVDSAAEETAASNDAATDLSRMTDRTSHTVPADGSPITISTKRPTSKADRLAKDANQSQTSLLIEYFEGGKDSDSGRRPSVRVKVTPSRKNKDRGEGHIVLTEAHGNRQPSYSRKISLTSNSPREAAQEADISSIGSLNILQTRGPAPVDIEIQQKTSDLSELSSSPEARYIIASSDISSMPADSILGAPQSSFIPPPPKVVESSIVSSVPTQSSLGTNTDVMESTSLKPPVLPRERNLSNERITQKVIEKLSNKPRDTVKIHRTSDKGSSRSTSRDIVASTSGERRRKSGKHFADDESVTTGTEPSLLSNSHVSAGAKSIDQHSVRSGASNVSITNPKLLQTVEDAIKRLILPQLEELKKDQRHTSHRSKHERDYSDLSESSISREDVSRRVSSGSKPKRRVSKGSGNSNSRRRTSRHQDYEIDSQSDISSPRRESVSSVGYEKENRSKYAEDDHKTRNMVAAGLVGAGLTASALKSRDSEDSLEHRRRRKRSKSRSSRSRSASVNESEEIFQRHEVPPMPMRSEIGSELTRSSLLSSNTAGTTTPTRHEVRDVIRGSPHQLSMPDTQTVPRYSGDLRQTLGTHHGNFSEHDLSTNRTSYEAQNSQRDIDYSPEQEERDSFDVDEQFADSERLKAYERNLHTQHPIRRGLSPIQSVASYTTTEPNRTSMLQPHSTDSLSSLRKQQQLKEEVSIGSFSSAGVNSRKVRPPGVSLENRSEIMHPHDHLSNGYTRELEGDEFYDQQHTENDRYRDSYASSDFKDDLRHHSTLTRDSSDVHYDKVGAGQQVAHGYGANPEFIHTPGAESAVASLVEPSVVDVRDSQVSYNTDPSIRDDLSVHSASRDLAVHKSGSPLKEQLSMNSKQSLERHRHIDASPPQSPASTFDRYHNHQDESVKSHSATPNLEPEPQSPDSGITTNPSIIHGPIGGMATTNRDHWPYDPTPPRSAHATLSRDFSSGAGDLIPEGLNVSQRQTLEPKTTSYVIGQSLPADPATKDEGYITGDNYPSPGPYAQGTERAETFTPDRVNVPEHVEDPFSSKQNQYLSGLSQGMSPLYDSATGRGIEKIQSHDIVALMDHLTVRDAQRNARDTEILVTLVRSAAEMRNSFEDMKKFIAEQDDMIIDTSDKQHEKTQKVIGGPRPQPAAAGRVQRSLPSQEDLPTKRRNVFRRALQGLGSKNTQELQNIESMLMQLLDDVEDLRTLHGGQIAQDSSRLDSMASTEQHRAANDIGYEPEGQAGTSSTGDRSGAFSNNSSRQAQYQAARHGSGTRVSTVMEGNEDDDYEDDQRGSIDRGTPHVSPFVNHDNQQTPRGVTMAQETPSKRQDRANGASENENTPHGSYQDSSAKKHKSFASSFFPKMVSRWSKTTASSSGDYRASTQQKSRPYSQVSDSGSHLGEYTYEPTQDDRLRSNTSLRDDQYEDDENRPPSPLIPSQVSDNPKYQAHRNSSNLQHPQPRQGPTGRYQYRLESEAQNYNPNDQFSPTSQTSSQWENQGGVLSMDSHAQPQQTRYVPQAPLSPISDTGYSDTSSAIRERDGNQRTYSAGSTSSVSKRGPPRPPKVMADEPLVPQRPSKVPMSPSNYVDHVAAARAGSPAFDRSPITGLRSPQGRKPSGPRPLSGQGKRTRFNNSPLQHDSEDDGAY